MNINWKVRLKNKYFWLGLIPAMLILFQQVASIFGVAMELSTLQSQLVDIIGTVFSVLALIGVVNDPTTAGVGDSEQAMTYIEPKK